MSDDSVLGRWLKGEDLSEVSGFTPPFGTASAAASTGYIVDDSGEREHFTSGMQRDTAKGKPNPLLVRDGPMYQRWVQHLTAGAEKYDARNWMLAEGIEEFERFLESATRHYDVWLAARLDELAYWRQHGVFEPVGTPEDEAAATWFNMNSTEYVRGIQDI